MQTDFHAVRGRQDRPAMSLARWLMPRPFYLVSTGFYLSVLLPFLVYFVSGQKYQGEWWRMILMGGAVLFLLGLDRLEFRLYGEDTPHKAAIILIVLRMVIYEAIAWLDGAAFSPTLAVFIPLLGYWYFGAVVASLLAGLACVDYILHHLLDVPGWLYNPYEIHDSILFGILLFLALAVVHVLMKEKASRLRSEGLLIALEEAHRQQGEAHRQLQVYAEQVEELATMRERNRLARDIHDSLGHYLTIINVQLEKSLSFQDRDRQQAEQATLAAKRMASEALQDVRRSVSTLREHSETFLFMPAATELVERLRSRQLELELIITGNEVSYSRQVQLTLYRVLQEGLTNMQKHAGECSAQILICFDETVATLRIQDTGRGFDPHTLAALLPGRASNYGLQGARERLELIGGSLQIESMPGEGTCILASIPRAFS
ncbi:sensor histidine kinase [Dictyobacter kobayashii]|uniref:histidine kinase n=1 Tax=Dictyobacter kobayashii TaxID=2014872 RepID=A0A402AYZ3_9CHLR|nr:sensor histidine kinase [Dictyobacter kobayashii]GCE24322.1 hypothetical protein KDK_81220 [Dictyobacter kobayashii]